MKKLMTGIAFIPLTMVTNAFAADTALETCISEVQKQKPGNMLKLEKLVADNKPMYELEVIDANGFEWEFMCDAESGKVTESESEVSSTNSIAFKSKMVISEDDAKKIALKAYPGVIEEVEYEIEANGDGSFEFDIVSSKGVETKVEVDAATGKIIEVATETWEIGEENEEKR